MEKKFEKHDLDIMQELIGKVFTDIFKQLDMFIINFGKGIEYSLHTFVFCRVKKEDEILLTCNDEYFTANFKCVSSKVYEKDEMHRKSLLRHTIEKVKKELHGAIVSKVIVMNNADIYIEFNNGVIIESLIDRKKQNFEYYRFIKFIPSYEEAHEKGILSKGPHIVVEFIDGQTITKTRERMLEEK